MVRLIGLEPTRRKTPDPKSGASTNFATGALSGCKGNIFFPFHQIYFKISSSEHLHTPSITLLS